MPFLLLFFKAGMLSLRSGLFLFYQETCEASLKTHESINDH